MSKSEKIVGMVVPTVDNSFFSNLAYHVEEELSAVGHPAIIMSCANDADKERDNLKRLADMQVGGIICVSGLSELPEDILPEALPLVLVDRVPASKRAVAWVANDDAQAMEKAVDHLLQKGCKNIALLPGFIAEKQENPRIVGYRDALNKHGLDFDEKYVLNRIGTKSSEEEAGDLIQRLIRSGAPIDGIIASSDRAAFGAVRGLQSVGYFVPEDVRILGFDNSPYSGMASPSITSLDRKADLLAKKAVEILLRLMEGQDIGTAEHVIPVELVERDSTR